MGGIPEGYQGVIPYLIVDGAAEAIGYYQQAFGATEVERLARGDRIAHAEIRIGEDIVMLADEFPDLGMVGPNRLGGCAASFMIYVEDVDTVFASAIAAGGREERPVKDQFYGDRSGALIDPFGHRWTLATHVREVTIDEMRAHLAAMAGSD
ncbi:MAG: VOC family protein [Sphingosinicella sp.]